MEYICIDCNNRYLNKKSFTNHRRYGCPKIKKSDIKCKYCIRFMPKRKPSEQGLFCGAVCYALWRSINNVGKNAPNYKHGNCHKLLYIRSSKIYRTWVLQIFKRDKFSCRKCGDDKGGNLEAHHIKSFALICYENNAYTIEKAKDCKELWELNNGLTLCKGCHKLTGNYGYNENTKSAKI